MKLKTEIQIVLVFLCFVQVFSSCTNSSDSIDDNKSAKVISTAKADYFRAVDYDKGGKKRLAEHYYKRAFEKYGKARSRNWPDYSETGYRWAFLRFERGDTDGALSVVSDLLAQAKNNEAFPKRIKAALLMLMADSQMQLQQKDEARKTYEMAYEAQQADNDYETDLPWASMSVSCTLYNSGDIEGAQEWLDRCTKEFAHFEQHGDSLLVEEWKGHIALTRALYLQATGRKAEAAAIFASVPRSRIFEPHGYYEAAEYLMAAGRYDEAIYWYKQLDSTYVAADGTQLTFTNIASHLSPKYLAYRKAGRKEEALIMADSVNAVIDSALVWQKKNNADELVIIYETHEKELALEESIAETRIHRILLTSAILIILLIGYLLWRSYNNYKVLTAKNHRLVEEIELREHEEQQAIEQLKSEPEEFLTTQQQLFRRICNLMESPEHIFTNTDLDRNRLAQLIGTNDHYITDAISACTNGKSVNGFINEYRLRHAAHLLATTTDSVALVAELSGFARSSFFRIFSEAYGMSPSDYRKVAKKQ